MTDENDPQASKRRTFVFTIRRSTEPGVPDAMVGVVYPDDPWIQQGVEDTQGYLLAGDQVVEAVGVFPMRAKPVITKPTA